ncbi:MAG: EAL domain-containing protein [Nocardioides sp.]
MLQRPMWRDAAPFVVVAAIVLTSVALPPHDEGAGGRLWLIFGIFAAALGLLAVSLRRPERTWLDPFPAYLFFGVIALARDLTGGAASGLALLVALPILWLAMTGTRRELYVAGGLTAAVFLIPMFTIGAPDYPFSDWRRALFGIVFAVVVAPVIQRMVRQLARESQRASEAAAEMDGIMRGARLTSMISMEADGTIRSFSLGAEELLGYRADALVGLGQLSDLHDAREIEDVAQELGVEPGFAVFAQLAHTRAPSRIWTKVRADGGRVLVRLALTELHDDAGNLTGFLAIGIDATAAVEAERALTQSEAQWRLLMENLPATTVVVIDEELRIRVVAGTGAIRQGLQGTEGRLLSEVANAENNGILSGLIEDALAGGVASGEIRASATGAEHHVTVTPLPADGDVKRVLVLARDVSVDRERERALLREKRRAERLFADAPHGVVVLTSSGIVLQTNAALRAIIGAAPGQLEGHPLADLSLPGDEILQRHLAQMTEDSGRHPQEWTLRDVGGRDVSVALSSRLLSAVEGSDDVVLMNVVDVSEARRHQERLAHLADHDVLTGIANRRKFDEELQRHLSNCQRHGPRGALLLLDLDHFKEVNDTLGHGAGDQLLISTAHLIRHGVRSNDIVARLGGDEFAVLLTDGDRASAEVAAASLVKRIREHTNTLDGRRRRVTASIGVVTLKAAGAHEADVLALADMTMYDAKDAGRDRYVVLEEDIARPPRSGALLQWQARIEEAIETDNFVLHLQPIMDLRTNTVTAAEVLLRMRDGDELVPPGRFVHIAERVGLVAEVDAWVVEHSVAMLAELRRLQPEFRLEVNVSGQSIGHPEIERVIVDCLRQHAVDPGALILEITETAAVSDVLVARKFAERMTALGCQFALDDFGAGFGSFYYLKHLLFDYVKIDGEFVATCHRSSVDRTILRSIVGIARDLGKQTVAEFVSAPAILDVVRAEGVDYAQGFLIGEPLAYQDFVTRFVSTQSTTTPALSSGASSARASVLEI